MKIDPLLEPLSEDAPCGEDLKKSRDPDFLGVFLASSGRLPRDFVQRGGVGEDTGDRIFDRGSINFRDEARPLDELLTRSRDLRFLAVRAQWAALAANLPELADSVEACAALLETFDAHVVPLKADERRRALNGLNNTNTIVLPLQFLGLTGTSDVTLRKIRIARGDVKEETQLSFERDDDIQLQTLLDSLGGEANAKAVGRTHEQLFRLKAALERIDKACKASATAPTSPDLSRVLPTVEQILTVISEVREDLSARPDPEPEAEAGDAADDGPGAAPAAAGEPAAAPQVTGPEVVSAAHARRLLEACEAYFRAHEPSSAALLMVTQARLLIGRPLIEAIETLMPDFAGQAVITFGPQSDFAIGMDRLRGLSEAGGAGQDDAQEADPGPEVSVTNGAEAAAAIRSAETWFRQTERSSPIPMLLERARGYLGRDFQSIVSEMIPRPPE